MLFKGLNIRNQTIIIPALVLFTILWNIPWRFFLKYQRCWSQLIPMNKLYTRYGERGYTYLKSLDFINSVICAYWLSIKSLSGCTFRGVYIYVVMKNVGHPTVYNDKLLGEKKLRVLFLDFVLQRSRYISYQLNWWQSTTSSQLH